MQQLTRDDREQNSLFLTLSSLVSRVRVHDDGNSVAKQRRTLSFCRGDNHKLSHVKNNITDLAATFTKLLKFNQTLLEIFWWKQRTPPSNEKIKLKLFIFAHLRFGIFHPSVSCFHANISSRDSHETRRIAKCHKLKRLKPKCFLHFEICKTRAESLFRCLSNVCNKFKMINFHEISQSFSLYSRDRSSGDDDSL